MTMADVLEFPGFIDVHVHFRDPGMTCAETLASGVAAARRGGFSAVVTMPNTSPACDAPCLLKRQIDFSPHILPSACITKERAGLEVADLEALADAGAAFFTDDGSYVADNAVMEEAMRRAAQLGMCVCQHAVDPAVLAGGVIRDCALARRLGLPVMPPEAETVAVRRDISLCRETGCRLHVQHISTAEGVELVRSAQKEGLPVTAEATPHHLLLSCDDLERNDANFKMAPPLGTREDRAELRRAVKDGVLMFATDHAPHPAQTKSLGFAKSANGIIGLETAIAITYSVMVEDEGMTPTAWAHAWRDMPRSILSGMAQKRFDALEERTRVIVGESRKVEAGAFASLSRNSPFVGMEFDAWPVNLV